jgi:hypothetical protein
VVVSDTFAELVTVRDTVTDPVVLATSVAVGTLVALVKAAVAVPPTIAH